MTHLYSGTEVLTDAPLDNQGLAQAFSPTDLTASSLGSCMITIIGIKARDMGIDITGTTAIVTKIMASEPRRISEIQVTLSFPKQDYTDKTKTIIENAARNCPVAKSLHPDIKQNINFEW
jgi:uncharacterized OsmC-like protein